MDINLLINNGVDVNKSLEIFGDIDTYNATLNDFLLSCPDKMKRLNYFLEASDMANYAILVHSLKSDAKYFGFTKLSEIAYDHEVKSKANNKAYVYDDFNKLNVEATNVVNLVKRYVGGEQATQVVVPTAEQTQSIPQPVVTQVPVTVSATNNDQYILVVDDSNIVRKFIETKYNGPYKLMMIENGKSAIDAILANGDKIKCMLLDLNMPIMDGFQVLEYFKQSNLFSKIPVSLITGDSSKEAIDKAFTYPVVDMLPKPFTEEDIKRIVDKTIESINW